jgi:hypothetical protein
MCPDVRSRPLRTNRRLLVVVAAFYVVVWVMLAGALLLGGSTVRFAVIAAAGTMAASCLISAGLTAGVIWAIRGEERPRMLGCPDCDLIAVSQADLNEHLHAQHGDS